MKLFATAAVTLAAFAVAAGPAFAEPPPGRGATVETFICFFNGPNGERGLGEGRVVTTPSGQVIVLPCKPPRP